MTLGSKCFRFPVSFSQHHIEFPLFAVDPGLAMAVDPGLAMAQNAWMQPQAPQVEAVGVDVDVLECLSKFLITKFKQEAGLNVNTNYHTTQETTFRRKLTWRIILVK